jgi:hypothetical protein
MLAGHSEFLAILMSKQRGLFPRAVDQGVSMTITTPSHTVETCTMASTLPALAVIALVLIAFAAPFIVSRRIIQDLFFILPMLVLAQNWTLLAGYSRPFTVALTLPAAQSHAKGRASWLT